MSMNSLKPSFTKEVIYENVELCKGIYKITIKGSFKGTPGQFYMLKGWEKEPLLGRPISIMHIDEEKIEFLYAVVGEGTKLLSKLKKDDSIELTGPLGKGFDAYNIQGKIAVVSGGIGTAPMVYLVEQLKNCKVDVFAGFRGDVYCVDEMKPYVQNIKLSTEDGSKGHKGYVTEIFKPEEYDLVLCCGPEIMMHKVIKMCKEKNVRILVSMEKHMACGVGACLVCTCKTKGGNKRTCKDGPVFNGYDIVIGEEL